jgi:hypothetical protein
MRRRQQIESELTGYLDWVYKAENIILKDPELPLEDRDGIKECLLLRTRYKSKNHKCT